MVKKVEFGYKLQIEETENGFVSGYEVYPGNPRDENLIDDAMNRHKATFGKRLGMLLLTEVMAKRIIKVSG